MICPRSSGKQMQCQFQTSDAATLINCIAGICRMATLVADISAIHMSDHGAKFET
jgi:hypothetical protein